MQINKSSQLSFQGNLGQKTVGTMVELGKGEQRFYIQTRDLCQQQVAFPERRKDAAKILKAFATGVAKVIEDAGENIVKVASPNGKHIAEVPRDALDIAGTAAKAATKPVEKHVDLWG